MAFFRRFLRDTAAATAVEYAVLLALILMSVIAAIGTVGAQTGGLWSSIKTQVQTYMSGS
ncbi:MAG: Flp family type IVb pilin [Planctomycetes bacterium]|nr:Flp family type IVb pilin [Planctomycetota bacterium]